MADDMYRSGIYCPRCCTTYHVAVDASGFFVLTCPRPGCGYSEHYTAYGLASLPEATATALRCLARQSAASAAASQRSWVGPDGFVRPAWAERVTAIATLDGTHGYYCEHCGTTYQTLVDVRASSLLLVCPRCELVRAVGHLSEINALPEPRRDALWGLEKLPDIGQRDPTC